MPLGVFEPRRLMALMEQTKPRSSFLLDTFFRRREVSDTRAVEVDVIRGRRRLAPFVSPSSKGTLVNREGVNTRTVKTPYIKPKLVTEAGMALSQKAPGMTVYQGTPQQRLNRLLARDMLLLRDMVSRREEAMAAEALTTGRVTCVGEGIDVVVDFLRPATHNVVNTGTANAWDATGVDILAQLRGHARTIVQSSGLNPDICVMGSAAADALLAQLKSNNLALSMSAVELGQITLDGLHHGASYLGRLDGINYYEYNEWAEDAAGVEQPLIAANDVIFGASRSEATVHYGAIEDLAAGQNWAVPYFVKSWTEEDPSVRFLMAQSAPLPALHRVEAIMNIKAL